MSDVFGRHSGDGRLDAEVSGAVASRLHSRTRAAAWAGRTALAASLVLMGVAGALVSTGRLPWPEGLVLAAASVAVTAAAIVLAAAAGRRRRRVLEWSTPEGGVVIGLSAVGINLARVPLLEWETVAAVGIVTRSSGSRGRASPPLTTIALVVHDVDAARARVIDPRLLTLVRRFPDRRRAGPRRGLLAVELGELLPCGTSDRVVARLEEECAQRSIPLRRVEARHDLPSVLGRLDADGRSPDDHV